MNNIKVNPWAILLAYLIGQGLWIGWYYLTEGTWMGLTGLTPDFVAENQDANIYLKSAMTILMMVCLLAWVFSRMGIRTAVNGLLTGLAIAYVFTHLPGGLRDNLAFRPSVLTWVEGGVYVLIGAVSGLILGAWPKQDQETSSTKD